MLAGDRWIEALRRSQQELDLGEEGATHLLNERVAAIGRTLSTDEIVALRILAGCDGGE